MSQETHEFVANCKAYIERAWQQVVSQFELTDSPPHPLADRPELIEMISDWLTGGMQKICAA